MIMASVGGPFARGRRFALDIPQAQVVENLYIYKNFIVEIKATLISDVLPQNVAGYNDFNRLCQLYV
jgi:hypothetical protein